MPKTESTQHKLDRVRSPRVHITYDVEVGGAHEQKELPFVVGVLGDFSGKPQEPLPDVRKRKFIEINRDNFDTVLASMKPRLALGVENRLTSEAGRINVELRFSSLEDFEPDSIVQRVEPLQELVEARRRLSDLLSRMDGNDDLEGLLTRIVNNSGKEREQLSRELEQDAAAAADGGPKEGEE